MRILIIGGTVFVGRHLTAAALARGHQVTLFTRGRHGAELFPEAEHLHGDRDGGLDALQGRTWDAVIDTCGYVPRIVKASAELLAGNVGHYTFISTISVFRDNRQPGMDESAPVGTLADPTAEQVTGESYGPLKALCEAAVTEIYGDRALIVRPGLIVGPYDYSGRFTYWPRRIARGGDVLAPGDPRALTQFIDARDLAAWLIEMVEAGRGGVYNATGPAAPLTLGDVLQACVQQLNPEARLVWVPEQVLLTAGVQPWIELPLWLPDADGENAGFSAVDCRKALAAGLRFRPLEQTIRDTYEWDRLQPAEPQADGERLVRPGAISAERERELLAAWRAADEPVHGSRAVM